MILGQSQLHRSAGRAGDGLPPPKNQPTVGSKRAARGENNTCLAARMPAATRPRGQHASNNSGNRRDSDDKPR